MTLAGINDSSNVVATGYQDGLLRVVFSDGSVYDAEDIPAAINAAFLAAPSKGAFVAQWLKGKLKRCTTDPATQRVLDSQIALREPEPSPKPLNSHDADRCCGRLIGEALRLGKLDTAHTWTCPKCGMEWRPIETRADKPQVTRSAMNPLFNDITYPVAMRHWAPCPYVASVPLLKR